VLCNFSPFDRQRVQIICPYRVKGVVVPKASKQTASQAEDMGEVVAKHFAALEGADE
jgi:hypothetical protein